MLVDELLEIEIRIVGRQEQDAGDQEFIIAIVILRSPSACSFTIDRDPSCLSHSPAVDRRLSGRSRGRQISGACTARGRGRWPDIARLRATSWASCSRSYVGPGFQCPIPPSSAHLLRTTYRSKDLADLLGIQRIGILGLTTEYLEMFQQRISFCLSATSQHAP